MRIRHLSLCCALVLGAGSAAAQVKSFLLVPGVPGESTSDGRKGWIDLHTVSVGVVDRSCTGVTVTKNLDTSSPLLSGAALNGGLYASMTIEVTRTADGRAEVFLSYLLENVSVAAVQTSSTPSSPVFETVQLAPATIRMTYLPPSTGGPAPPPVSFPLTCAKK